MLLGPLSTGGAQTPPKHGVAQEPCECRGESCDVVRWYEERVPLVLDHLGNPADRGRHHGHRSGKGLEDYERIILGPRGQRDDVGVAYERTDPVVVRAALEDRAVADAEIASKPFQHGAVGAVTYDAQGSPVELGPGQRPKQYVHPLLPVQPSHQEQVGGVVPGRVGGRGEPLLPKPVPNGREPLVRRDIPELLEPVRAPDRYGRQMVSGTEESRVQEGALRSPGEPDRPYGRSEPVETGEGWRVRMVMRGHQSHPGRENPPEKPTFLRAGVDDVRAGGT